MFTICIFFQVILILAVDDGSLRTPNINNHNHAEKKDDVNSFF